ncbi:MAG: hypothetical protein COC16_00245 [Lutibacter sp.]|nr:MAG: hypothetical protein COC16_00245 [Lutibacter sp.]
MKKNKKASLLYGCILVILITTSPYLLYLYKSIPPDITQLNTIFGVLKGGEFRSVQTFILFIFAKFVPLFLLILLFFTNKDWWSYALLVPISVYFFQLFFIINESSKSFDEIEFIYTTPVLIPVLVILYFIRYKISIYIDAVDLKKEMNTVMKNSKKMTN